jgi:hypothetical protein
MASKTKAYLEVRVPAQCIGALRGNKKLLKSYIGYKITVIWTDAPAEDLLYIGNMQGMNKSGVIHNIDSVEQVRRIGRKIW